MPNELDMTKDDEIVNVQLPLRDYKVMREMIDERQAMQGLKKLLSKIFWFAGGLLAVVGAVEALKAFSTWK